MAALVDRLGRMIETWEVGGRGEVINLLVPHFLSQNNPDGPVIIATTLCAIINSALKSTTIQGLSPDAIATFIHQIVGRLPSSSAGASGPLAVLNDAVIDALWSVDTEVDDRLFDAKLAVKNLESQGPSPASKQAEQAAVDAEADKDVMVAVLQKFLAIGVLDVKTCRERLDLTILVSNGLVADKFAFEKREVRTRTAIFYKQNKFNLVREQSEGYTKLATELVASLGPPHDPFSGSPVESNHALQIRARAAWSKLISLIGYFDLDPNRALDLTLDIFSIHIASHYAFFLALLRCSPWCRQRKSSNDPTTAHSKGPDQASAAGISSSPDVDMSDLSPAPDGLNGTDHEASKKPCSYSGKTLDEVLRIAEGNVTLGDHGQSPVCAQVLGFKFAGCQNEEAPKNLFLTAALLIREGFINLEDLYPHLSPGDEEMPKIERDYLDSLQTAASASSTNALAAAAPLSKDDIPQRPRQMAPEPSKSATQSKKGNVVPRQPLVQKIGITAALLSLGAIRPAVSLITKFPWMVHSHPEISDLLLRILKISIKPRFDSYFPRNMEHVASLTQPRMKWFSGGRVEAQAPKPVLTVWAPTPPGTVSTEFVFFYPHWQQNIPLCESDRDTEFVIEPLVNLLGFQIHRDLNFVVQLCQVARQQLAQQKDTYAHWLRMLRLHILPAVSMTGAQSILAVDVWNVLKNYEVAQRWQLYAEWGHHTYTRHPELGLKRTEVNREVKNLLRRLSNENVDDFHMTVAKLAHSNPCLLFSIAVNQVQAYENMAPELIKALSKVTILAHDVLTYVILDAFSKPDRDHMKDDGISVSDWLMNLSTFASGLFRVYPRMELSSMLRYITHQFSGGEHKDVVILQDLIAQMCGIHPLLDLSESQIVGMRGGPVLRTEAVASSHRGVLSTFISRTLDRFNGALKVTELSLPLLLLLAQQRQSCVHTSRKDHLKALAHLYDISEALLCQYIDALTMGAHNSNYVTSLPPLSELSTKYGIENSIAMLIYRPKLRMELSQFKDLAEKSLRERSMASRGNQQSLENSADISRKTPEQPSEGAPWVPMLESVGPELRKILPQRAQDTIGVHFYLTFWQLTMYDLICPIERYSEETLRLKTILTTVKDKIARRTATDADELQKTKANNAIALLAAEAKAQVANCAAVQKRLELEKNHWFSSIDQASAKFLAVQIIKYCLHPRALLSQSDADYCAHIIHVLHTMGTPGFLTTFIYDKLLDDCVTTTIFSCSEQEAVNYGRFLMGILTNLSRLHDNEEAWKKYNMSGNDVLPGFQRSWTGKEKLERSDLLAWSEFRSLNKKWHKKLAATFDACLRSEEYIHIHNAIVILKEILEVFPVATVNSATGKFIYRAIELCHAHETRRDLQILAASYKARLHGREKFWMAPDAPSESKPKSSQTGAIPTQPRQNGRVAPPPSSPAPPKPTPVKETPSAQLAKVMDTSNLPQMPKADLPPSNPPPDPARSDASNVELNHATKLALESIPRPEVVKRVRGTPVDGKVANPADGDGSSRNTPVPQVPILSQPAPPAAVSLNGTIHQEVKPIVAPQPIVPPSPLLPLPDVKPPSSETTKIDSSSSMPPPKEPSQTLSANELRNMVKQSTQQAREANGDTKTETENNVRTSSSRPESRNPTPPPKSAVEGSSRGELRNESPDSRASGSRSDRDTDRADRHSERRSKRGEEDEGRSSRSERRDRPESGRDRDRDRDHRDRDRNRDRERDRRRDWEKSEREHKEKEPSRASASSSRRDYSDANGGGRAESTRSRQDDDQSSKRRKLSDEEVDRSSSKRNPRHERSGRDGRDDRSSRHRDKDSERTRDGERRPHKRERESRNESDSHDRHGGDDTSHQPSDRNARSSEDSQQKRHAAEPPSAPRAMASEPTPRSSRTGFDQSRDSSRTHSKPSRDRDQALYQVAPPGAPASHRSSRAQDPPSPQVQGGSLRARISESREPTANPPKAETSGDSRASENIKKRPADRENDEGEGPPDSQAPKRKRIDRTRYVAGINRHLDSERSRQGRS
ncbi:hypothetical protein SISNIDRAFT_481583 [Sistotremastrum niveocremeum HHB9708]|uniref:THO complex subunit 2 n=1 Tax=Sistotremastrum niveocremeum HHB9708 TaxID=1314777 RepID=A0A164ZFH7_9AGAM|nr:hypothetical protein SISNIDRAFT_481583 [Sistotremastrum niveocremeum HHB9708]